MRDDPMGPYTIRLPEAVRRLGLAKSTVRPPGLQEGAETIGNVGLAVGLGGVVGLGSRG
jgi:hypothetical protein